MARSRGQSDPARTLQAVLSTFRGGLTGANEAMARRREQEDSLRRVEAAGEQNRLTAADNPERQAFEMIKRLIPTPQPEGGFNRAEVDAGIPGQVQSTNDKRVLEGMQRFGLLKTPSSTDPTAGIKTLMESGIIGNQKQRGIQPTDTGFANAGTPGTLSPSHGLKDFSISSDGQIRLNFGETPESKQEREVTTQVDKDIAKRRGVTQENFQKTIGLIQQFTAQFKAKLAAQPGGKGGFVQGAVGELAAFAKVPSAAPIAAVPGQRTETILSLNSILTGQNRVIQGVIQMIDKTLPGPFDPIEFLDQKIAQTVTNAFRLFKAANTGIITEDIVKGFGDLGPRENFTDEELLRLSSGSSNEENRFKAFIDRIEITPEEQSIIDDLVQKTLTTPAAESATAKKNRLSDQEKSGSSTPSFSSVAEAEAANLPSGTEIMIKGRRARVD